MSKTKYYVRATGERKSHEGDRRYQRDLDEAIVILLVKGKGKHLQTTVAERTAAIKQLFLYTDMPQREIAKYLGLSLTTVERHIRKLNNGTRSRRSI